MAATRSQLASVLNIWKWCVRARRILCIHGDTVVYTVACTRCIWPNVRTEGSPMKVRSRQNFRPITFFLVTRCVFLSTLTPSSPSSHYLFLIWSVIEMVDVDAASACNQWEHKCCILFFVEQISNFLSVNRDHPYAVRSRSHYSGRCVCAQTFNCNLCEIVNRTEHFLATEPIRTHSIVVHIRCSSERY